MKIWKKQTPHPTSTNQQEHDHLSVIKAAAWAWYQHGSGINNSQTKTSEIDVSRTRFTTPCRPTRYKLEVEALQSKPEPLALLSSSSSSLLLDLYEVERITRELDDLIGLGKKENGSKRVGKKVNGIRVICGSRSDVVEAAVVDGRRHRKTRMVSSKYPCNSN